MSKRVLLVRHSSAPADNRAIIHLAAKGFVVDIRSPFRGDDLGTVTPDLAGLIVFGGMFNAYDTELHPFLKEEYRVIDAAMSAGLPVLGICQGAQMIARHLGAWAGAPEHGMHEFGYYQVSPTRAGEGFLDRPLFMAQSHFHSFDIPQDAVHLARSDLFENQAFRYGEKTYALQFHPEQTPAGFGRWQQKPGAAFTRPGAQRRAQQDALMLQHDAAQARWFHGFLDALFGDCARKGEVGQAGDRARLSASW